MQVYARILVAVDCSGVDDAVVAHMERLARQNEAAVYLLHVVHSHTLDQERALRQQAEQVLERHRDRLTALGIETQTVIRSGEPDAEILAEIDNGEYDLVAMATHGHSFFGDMLFGSVSRTLKHRISIPLLLIAPER